ncbi:MAG TPA: hypothetical protein VEQ60_07975 [Longimicrobium sp.]|nr:hypothetical protein [Longimicrobium sp.]
MRSALWLAIAISPLLMASQCYPVVDVSVAPGAAAGDPPSFQFAFRGDVLPRVQSFEVRRCGSDNDRMVWQLKLADAPDTEAEQLRITYGRVPPGYRESWPAVPLEPGGCYRANAVAVDQPLLYSATFGGATFRVLPNRTMIVGSPGGLVHNTRPFRQLNRAAVGCHRGWRRARTRADSAAVDARRYPVLDDRPSCDWLNTHWPELMSEPASTERAGLALAGLLVLYVTLGLLSEQIPEWPQ